MPHHILNDNEKVNRAKLVRHIKEWLDEYTLIEIKVWEIPPDEYRPEGFKYSLAYIVKGERIIGYDNERGKGSHRHFKGTETSYHFEGVDL